VSVKQKIDIIRNLLKGSKEFSFNTLLSSAQNKTEVIMNFLAVLELLKEKSIFVKQSLSFDDMLIVKSK
jgi:segregation and condensation protein A